MIFLTLLTAADFQDAQAQQAAGPMTSCAYSFVRKQCYAGQTRIAQGQFYWEEAGHRACYDYSGAYRYRFILSDTAVIGIDKRANSGYTLRRSADPQHYEAVSRSVHVFGQLLRGISAFGDTVRAGVVGSVDSCIFLETKSAAGTDIVAVTRESGRPALIESFDPDGALYRQTRTVYGKGKTGGYLPSRLIVRTRDGSVVTLDTLLLSKAVVNQPLPPNVFGVSDKCRLVSSVTPSATTLPFFNAPGK